jgi:hypothetical protein
LGKKEYLRIRGFLGSKIDHLLFNATVTREQYVKERNTERQSAILFSEFRIRS